MKQFTLRLLTTIICLTILVSCKKDAASKDAQSDGLPPVSETGAEVIACKINGVNFINTTCASCSGYDVTGIMAGFNSTSFFIQGKEHNGTGTQTLYFSIIGLSSTGTYTVDIPNTSSTIVSYQNQIDIQYQASHNKSGTVTITKLDTVNHIVSGTFVFDLVNPSGDIIHVTDGRFDIKYS